jgi:replicative DNA helicase
MGVHYAMPDVPVQLYDWTDDFVRKVLALAARGEMSRLAPGAFQSRFFGVPGAQRVRSPRQRLAEIIERFTSTANGDRLDEITMDQLVKETGERLKPNERALLDQEWRAIRSMAIPDPQYVIERVRHWALKAAASDAAMRIAELIATDGNGGKKVDRKDIRNLMDEALRVGEADGQWQGYLLRDAQERIAGWGLDDSANHMPTGFEALDHVLNGGPMPGEVFYVMAPPKGAKTALLLNLALNASRARHNVAFFSYEMMVPRMLSRMDRNISRCTKHELRSDISGLERAVAGFRMSGAGEVVVHQFQARKQGCAEALRVVESLRANGIPVDMIVMDYLNIMSGESREHEKRHELAAISREMSQLAKELQVNMWSAALVKKEAVNKPRVYKTDITESFEVIAVLDGAIAVCSTEEMRQQYLRRLFAAALREEEDERDAGLYEVDLSRMLFREVPEATLQGPDLDKTEEK